jgi:uncharacterized protein YkwD
MIHAIPAVRGRVLAAALACLIAGAPLSACMSFFGKEDQIIEGAQPTPATVSPAAAAAKISDYRRSRGLPGVTVDARLNAIAERQASAMASADKMSHSVGGSFPSRLSRGGYNASIAAENVAAGHRNLDEALAGWRASRGHNANLLKPGVTAIGIAVAYTPNSKYGNFWALVLATPDERSAAALGPDAGPVVAATQE